MRSPAYVPLFALALVTACGDQGLPPAPVGGVPSGADPDQADSDDPGGSGGPAPSTSGTTTGAPGSTTDAATSDGATTDPSVGTSGGDGSSSGGTADATSGALSATGGSTGGDDGIIAEFDPPQPFGDDQREVDIIGTWGVPNLGNPQSWEATLEVQATGDFRWTERDPSCGVVTDGRGAVWIEGSQLVLHFDTFFGRKPWRTEDVIGVEFEAPFRLKLHYAPMGTYLGLSAPSGLTTSSGWTGRAYDRLSATSGPAGTWVSESELWGLAPHEPDPVLVLRDRYEADLQPDGSGVMTEWTTYWWPEQVTLPAKYIAAPWVDGNPGSSAGAATIAGGPYAYDSLRLITFGQWNALRLAPSVHCPASDGGTP